MSKPGAPPRKQPLVASEAPLRARQTVYPEPFAARVRGREKRPLGDPFQLKNFGVNWTRLMPGAESALRHHHSKQDEFVYVLEGHPTLITNDDRTLLAPGTCVAFPAGTGDAHHLVNRGNVPAVILEVGDRTPGDLAEYPDDDLCIVPRFPTETARDADGPTITFAHKDGRPYE